MSPEHEFPLRMTGKATFAADRTSLSRVRLGDGFTLPSSYCDFAAHYGYGLLGELIIIYVPMDQHGDSLSVRSAELHSMLRHSIDNELFEYEPDGSPELVQRLIPFGISENGHTLAWDPETTTPGGESMIYVVGSKALAVRLGAPDLYSFVERLLDERVKKILGSGYAPLVDSFRPLKPAGVVTRKASAKSKPTRTKAAGAARKKR